MKEKRYRLFFVISAVVLLVLALTAESLYFSDFEYHFRTRRFNKILAEKEKIMDDCLNRLSIVLARGEPHGSVSQIDIFSLADQHKITILEYFDNRLIYWSDNGFTVKLIQDDTLYSKPLIFLQNGWFIPATVQAGNEKFVGLLRVHSDYGFENDIIKNGFEKDFKIPADVGLSTEDHDSDYRVYKSDGTFLFSLVFPEVKSSTFFIFIPLMLWLTAFLLVLLLTLELVKILVSLRKNILAVTGCFLIFTLIYGLVLLTGKPEVIFRTGLFSPYIFSLNSIIPSLGHLVLFSILAAVFSYVFNRYFPIEELQSKKQLKNYLILTLLFTAAGLLFCLLHTLFCQLIYDSNINFETYKVLKLSFFSAAGYASVILLLLVPLFLLLKIFQLARELTFNAIILPLITSLIVFVLMFFNDPGALSASVIFYLIITILIWITGRRKIGSFSMSVIFSMVFGLYSLLIITVFSEKKATDNLKIQAISLSADHDPEAENLLLDLWSELERDSLFQKMMGSEYFQDHYTGISDYLRENYFSGYWGNYNYSIYLCRNDDSLWIGQSGDLVENCFDFFNERILKNGHRLTGTGFYFIDNQGGRSYYLGQIFIKKDQTVTNGLFIELYSDVNKLQPGYTELLLDKKFRVYSGLKDYSFAKYINGEIVLKSGEFPYNKTDVDYVDKNSEYRIFNLEGFKHILFKNSNVTVVLSKPELSIGDVIISFTYLFAFIFLFTNLVLLIIRRPMVRGVHNLNFRQKLQLSFIGILLFSFVSVGIVVIFFTIRQYHSKHNENIKEKVNSIYLELDSKISGEKRLAPDWSNNTYSSLNELLIKFSNIFNTDINLYDLNGFLLATSRPEIFSRGLTSQRMNTMAHINLTDLKKSEYFQTELIGNLKYISAYVPFYNTENNVLIYLNLPYFRMQSVLAREISNLIVAVINFTLLLILIAMSLAVFIGGRLASPLRMLSEGLASVELGKKSEHLSYRGSDEIGELVRQYNMMVDELEESAHKLANSEREYAWREMAKQIAHEIKNPLTPMKLNVQQLLKSWKDGVPGFEKKLEGFSKNQIEYIDNLSSIASAFSSFAKMPGTNPGIVDLLEQIRTTIELFRNTDDATFRVHWPHERKIFIYADKEQLNSVFSNIFKNGIQSIPQGRSGLIKVNLDINGDKVIISVSDNGVGIPEALQKKLFTPNFTTKSSGMGLGLSIVKRYVESSNGRIWFESEADKGTTFYIEFPLMYTVEKPGEAKSE
ncbi:MAG: HAMP domain-containing histidine kinase [Bacteroidales bacterium]|nr:HAMP domain-containing histidine kinase [Bacteroidales bacterium]